MNSIARFGVSIRSHGQEVATTTVTVDFFVLGRDSGFNSVSVGSFWNAWGWSSEVQRVVTNRHIINVGLWTFGPGPEGPILMTNINFTLANGQSVPRMSVNTSAW